MIILIDAEKIFNNIQHAFMKKSTKNTRKRKELSPHNKIHIRKPRSKYKIHW